MENPLHALDNLVSAAGVITWGCMYVLRRCYDACTSPPKVEDVVPCPACGLQLTKGDGCASVNCLCGKNFNWDAELKKVTPLGWRGCAEHRSARRNCLAMRLPFYPQHPNGRLEKRKLSHHAFSTVCTFGRRNGTVHFLFLSWFAFVTWLGAGGACGGV
jgi:hypothetical protein